MVRPAIVYLSLSMLLSSQAHAQKVKMILAQEVVEQMGWGELFLQYEQDWMAKMRLLDPRIVERWGKPEIAKQLQGQYSFLFLMNFSHDDLTAFYLSKTQNLASRFKAAKKEGQEPDFSTEEKLAYANMALHGIRYLETMHQIRLNADRWRRQHYINKLKTIANNPQDRSWLLPLLKANCQTFFAKGKLEDAWVLCKVVEDKHCATCLFVIGELHRQEKLALDPSLQYNYYTKAAYLGHPESAFNVGDYELNLRKKLKDEKALEGLFWLMYAKEQGFEKGKWRIPFYFDEFSVHFTQQEIQQKYRVFKKSTGLN